MHLLFYLRLEILDGKVFSFQHHKKSSTDATVIASAIGNTMTVNPKVQ